jgi:hypothetical protein
MQEEERKEEIKEEPIQKNIALSPIVIDHNKKVAIVGTSHSWMLAPFDDESFEIWGVNNGYLNLDGKRCTRWFDVHLFEKKGDKWFRRWDQNFRGKAVNDYLKDLAKLPCSVYMQEKNPEVPNSERFPIEEVIARFGTYITNSISMQIAYAIHLGFGEIALYGVDMSAGTEWEYQRPNAEYFIGLAVGMGIKVFIPGESDLVKTLFLYAYGEREKSEWVKKTDVIKKNMNIKINRTQQEIMGLQAQLEEKRVVLQQNIGAQHSLMELRQLWVKDFGHFHHPE